MILRTLIADDATAFFSLRLAGLRETPHAFGKSADEFERCGPSSMAQLIASSKEQGHFILGAFDESLVGVVGLQRQQHAKARHTAALWGMYVQPAARGVGIGRRLLEEFVLLCRAAEGLEQVKLAVESGNTAAIKLYRSVGFQRYGVEPRALRVDDRYFNEDLMMLRL